MEGETKEVAADVAEARGHGEDSGLDVLDVEQEEAKDAEEQRKGQSRGSTLGVALGKTWTAAATGESAEYFARRCEITKKITTKYKSCVKEAEKRKKLDFFGNLEEEGQEEQPYTSVYDLVCPEEVQTRIKQMRQHSKTGTFVEHYGTEGVYEGEFLYGMRHGRGTHTFRGEAYDGEWKWDQRHGWGELTLPDGSKIQSEWQKGKPHGYTSISDNGGNIIYEGEFYEGKRHGMGRQLFERGDAYDGGWAHGRLHDRGVYYFTSGDKLYGMWKNGLYDGIGVFHYADGSISRRVYKDGLLQSVQDYEQSSQRFGHAVNRETMHKHTKDKEFPKEVFLLSIP